MRRVKPWLMNGCAATVLTGAAVWGAMTLPAVPRLASMQDQAAESLSTVGLSVEEVLVTGRVNTGTADLLDALGAVRGTPILELDIPAARERINALPWVKSSEVVRRLPNSVSIAIEEHTGFAVWQRAGRYTLVARDGAEIIDLTTVDASLPVIVGEDAPQHVGALFDALAHQPQLTKRISAVVRFGGRRWDVMIGGIESGVTIKLPEADVAGAWAHLAVLDAEHRILSRAIQTIDLRIPGRTTVTLTQGYSIERISSGPKQEARASDWSVDTEEYQNGV